MPSQGRRGETPSQGRRVEIPSQGRRVETSRGHDGTAVIGAAALLLPCVRCAAHARLTSASFCRSLCWWKECSGVEMPKWLSSWRVCRVSSASTMVALRSTCSSQPRSMFLSGSTASGARAQRPGSRQVRGQAQRPGSRQVRGQAQRPMQHKGSHPQRPQRDVLQVADGCAHYVQPWCQGFIGSWLLELRIAACFRGASAGVGVAAATCRRRCWRCGAAAPALLQTADGMWSRLKRS